MPTVLRVIIGASGSPAGSLGWAAARSFLLWLMTPGRVRSGEKLDRR
jgi:hypothetical protein